jgi:hypothetical protein
MNTTRLVIAAIATATIFASGSVFAQSTDHGSDRFGPPFMRGEGPGGMPGMHGHMGMGGQMGPGMMGMGMHGRMGMGGHMGPGMMGMAHDSATMAQLDVIHDLFANHDRIKRTVTNLPDGIRTVTESDDPRIAALIKDHVGKMRQRVDANDDPGLPIESDSLRAIFRNYQKIRSTVEQTDKGIVVAQTSDDRTVVADLQQHASEVSDFVKHGMAALHAAMMRNHGGMMHGPMHGGMMHGPMGR